MALNPSLLKAGLEAAGFPFPKSPAEAAQRIATAYLGYASLAQSCLGLPPVLAGRDIVLAGALTSLFAARPLNPSATSSGMATAFTAFWTGVVFGSGAVTVIGGAGALGPDLLSVWRQRLSRSAAAQGEANALHTFTTSVVVVHPPPTPCSGGIS
jgi:hypothetical protein